MLTCRQSKLVLDIILRGYINKDSVIFPCLELEWLINKGILFEDNDCFRVNHERFIILENQFFLYKVIEEGFCVTNVNECVCFIVPVFTVLDLVIFLESRVI